MLSAIRDALRSVDVDVVFLQEVHGAHALHAEQVAGWPTESQFEYLADSVWSHFAYGKNAIYSDGHHGNALLSKYPIVTWSNYDISTNRFESRGVLHAVLALEGRQEQQLHCFCVHLGLTGKGRKIQLAEICSRIAQEVPGSEPLLLAGDFNDWRLSASRVLSKIGLLDAFGTNKGKRIATFPARFPVLQLDRIYCRGLNVKKIEVLKGGPWRQLSDHAAVCAELEFEN